MAVSIYNLLMPRNKGFYLMIIGIAAVLIAVAIVISSSTNKVRNTGGNNITVNTNISLGTGINVGTNSSISNNTQNHEPANPSFIYAFGGSGSDIADRVDKTAGDGYYFAGYTSSYGSGNKDLLLVKLNNTGKPIWIRTLGGVGDECSDPETAYQTKDGGFVLAGRVVKAQSPDCNSIGQGVLDWIIAKFDADGKLLWKKTLGQKGDEWLYSVQQTKDGGYILGGWTTSFDAVGRDFLIIKLDSNASISWIKVVGGGKPGSDEGYSIRQTSDGGYVMAGFTQSMGKGGGDMLVVKLDINGAIEWSNAYGTAGLEMPKSIRQTSDGGYIVAGRLSSNKSSVDAGCQLSDMTGDCNFAVMKITSSGALEWFHSIGGNKHDFGWTVRQARDGGYLIGGFTYSFGHGGQDGLIVKLDNDGKTMWARTYGGKTADGIFSIGDNLDTNGGFVASGWTFSKSNGERDAYVMNLDGEGKAIGFCPPGNYGSIEVTAQLSNMDVTDLITTTQAKPNVIEPSPDSVIQDVNYGSVAEPSIPADFTNNACGE